MKLWYEDRNSLARLLEQLDEHGLIDGSDLDAVVYAIRKPWKYRQEWDHLIAHGSLENFAPPLMSRTVKIHPSITHERLMAAVEESMVGMNDDGFCVACGADAMGVEPDAELYECSECGERAVYGAEQLLFLTVA